MRPQQYPGGAVANSLDMPSVYICFQERSISELFADLLVSRGVRPVLGRSLDGAPAHTRIVTEPCFFPQLSPEQASQCLIVGPRKTLRSIEARCLEQPLTEDGVEEALEFLVIPVQRPIPVTEEP